MELVPFTVTGWSTGAIRAVIIRSRLRAIEPWLYIPGPANSAKEHFETLMVRQLQLAIETSKAGQSFAPRGLLLRVEGEQLDALPSSIGRLKQAGSEGVVSFALFTARKSSQLATLRFLFVGSDAPSGHKWAPAATGPATGKMIVGMVRDDERLQDDHVIQQILPNVAGLVVQKP